MTQKEKNENIKPEYNVQIPVQVFMHPEIDPYSLKIFTYMKFRYQFFQLQGGTFHESNTTISDATGVSRSKVIESINKLVSLGFVVRQERHGLGSEKANQTNIYTVMDILTPNGVVVKQVKKAKKSVQKEPEKIPTKVETRPSWGDEEDPF